MFYVNIEFLWIEFPKVSFFNLGCFCEFHSIKLFKDNKIRHVITDFRSGISAFCLIFD